MSTVREPAVANLFYPGDAQELERQVDLFLDEARAPADATPPKAIIVPHAGYPYSGPVAATAYARILPLRDKIKRVVLLGPSHRVPLLGLASSSADLFRTPLGDIPLDRSAIEELEQMTQVHRLDQAHMLEHSLEVHLPFLQRVLGNFSLIPLVVGDASPQDVGTVLEQLWGDEETLIVISSDLSHYHSYEEAKELDRTTSEAIEGLNIDAIGYGDACGRNPINGLLWLARRKKLEIKMLDLRSSGDTAGDKSRVVGYGAYLVQ